MTRRRTKQTRRQRRPKTIVEETLPEEEEVLEEENDEFEEDEEEEEEEEEASAPRRRRRIAKEPDDTEDEEAPSTRRRRRIAKEPDEAPKQSRRRRGKAKEAAPDATPEAKIGQASGGELLEAILQVIDEGYSITIVKIAGKYLLHKAGCAKDAGRTRARISNRTMTRKDFEEIAYSEEFKKFYPEWAKFTYEEKVEVAESENISWKRHETPKIDVMRLTTAVRTSRGIEKWKSQYNSREARKDLFEDGIFLDDAGEPTNGGEPVDEG